MAEPRLFLQNRSFGQTLLRVAFVCSILLNVYFLFIRDLLPSEAPAEKEVVVQGVTISHGGETAVVDEEGTDPEPPQEGSTATESSDQALVASSAGRVLDKESGLRLLELDVNRSFAYTFAEAMGSEAGDLVSAVYSRIFMWKLDLRSGVRAGDRIALIYRILPKEREVDIRAATYRSDKHKQRFEAYLFKPEGHAFGNYYDEEGIDVALRLENTPIGEYEQITSLLRDRNRHNGIDFKAPIGTSVTVPFDGKVTRINWRSRNGNCIEIRYDKSKLLARFLHLDRLKSGIKAGVRVRGGSVIAESGNTGHSTAPHLHYELARPNGRTVDPLKFHETHRDSIPPESMPEFEQIRDHWRKFFSDET